MSFFKKIDFKNYCNIFFIVFFASWFFLIISIGSNSVELMNSIINIYKNGLSELKFLSWSYDGARFGNIRAGSVLFVMIVMLLYLTYEINKLGLSVFRKINFELAFFVFNFLYIFSGLVGLFSSCNYKDGLFDLIEYACEGGLRKEILLSLHMLVGYFDLLLIYLIVVLKKETKYVIPIFAATLTFIVLMVAIILIKSDLQYGSFDFIIPIANLNLSMNSNGQGRIMLILLVFLHSVFISKFFQKKIINIVIFLSIIIISWAIIALEGKFNILMIFGCSFVSFFYIYKDKLKIKIFYFLLVALFPIAINQLNLIHYENVTIKKICENKGYGCFKMHTFIHNENTNRLFTFLKRDQDYRIFEKLNITQLDQVKEELVTQVPEEKLVTQVPEEELVEKFNAIISGLDKQLSKQELAKEEPVKEKPVKEELVKEEPVKEELVKEEPVKEELAKEEPVKEELAKQELAKQELVKQELVKKSNEIIDVLKKQTTKEELVKKSNEIMDVLKKQGSKIVLNQNNKKLLNELDYISQSLKNNSELLKIEENKLSTAFLKTRKAKRDFVIADIFLREAYYGHGPEYDRVLFSNLAFYKIKHKPTIETIHSYAYLNSDAANGFLYGILSAGFFGFVYYIFIIILFITIVIKYHFSNHDKSILLNFSIFTFGIILARSFIENGFMSWNFDQILLVSSIMIKKKKKKELNFKSD